jgi:hypothetical protein
MWIYVKWTFLGALAMLMLGTLHYYLPHHDTVRITDTYNRQTTIGSNWLFYAGSDFASGATEKRDVRYIETIRPNGGVSVFHNEDTGWFWPPYLKYDSTNLQAEASNLKSTEDAPQWVSVSYYGWRSTFLSIYPNAVAVRAVAGPDVGIFPWGSVIVLALLALAGAGLVWLWRELRRRVLKSFGYS